MMQLKQWILATALCSVAGVSQAQSLQEVQARYPNSRCISELQTELRLFLQNDTPVAERKQVNDLMILSENNAGPFFSRSAVYHSGFNQLTGMEAYTLLPGSKEDSHWPYQNSKQHQPICIL